MKEIKPIRTRNKSSVYAYPEFNNFATLEDYRNAFEKFKAENGRYPTVTDMDKTPYLVTSRTIQRNFEGGVKGLRSALGFTGSDLDQTTGPQRSSLTSLLNIDGVKIENELYFELTKEFGVEKVHRQEPYSNIIKNLARSDFGIYSDRHFYIDVFIPSNDISLMNCVAIKLKKLKKHGIDQEIFLVIGNKAMDNKWFDSTPRARRILDRLPSNIKLITYEKCLSLIKNNFIV